MWRLFILAVHQKHLHILPSPAESDPSASALETSSMPSHRARAQIWASLSPPTFPLPASLGRISTTSPFPYQITDLDDQGYLWLIPARSVSPACTTGGTGSRSYRKKQLSFGSSFPTYPQCNPGCVATGNDAMSHGVCATQTLPLNGHTWHLHAIPGPLKFLEPPRCFWG